MKNKKPLLKFTRFSSFEEFLLNLDIFDKQQLERTRKAIIWDNIKEFFLEKHSNYLLLIVPNAGAFEFYYSDRYFNNLWNYFKRLEKKGIL